MELEEFYRKCSTIAEKIDSKRKKIHEILSTYETDEVIKHQIESSIRALKNVASEYADYEQPDSKIAASCFLPVNLPLYSLVLYAIIPGFYFENIYLRPGISLSTIIPELVDLLSLKSNGFNNVHIKDLPAKLFVDLYAKDSEVILFTGKYENAQMLERECPESMLIFEGTGPCPFFVFENADVELAAQKAVDIRCFNGGQDCVAPDVMFVHESKVDAFTKNVIELLKDIKVGSSSDPEVRVAQMIKEKYMLDVEEWLQVNRNHIVYGGEVDSKNLIIHPTVLSQHLNGHDGSYKEFFAPIFNIVVYGDDKLLLNHIEKPNFKERSMYAIVFGDNRKIVASLSLCTVLRNQTVNDQEDGNKSYGGFGPLANFVSYKGKRQAHPLLISRDVREWMLAHNRANLPDKALQVA